MKIPGKKAWPTTKLVLQGGGWAETKNLSQYKHYHAMKFGHTLTECHQYLADLHTQPK